MKILSAKKKKNSTKPLPEGLWTLSTERDGFNKDEVCELLSKMNREITELVMENNKLTERINAIKSV